MTGSWRVIALALFFLIVLCGARVPDPTSQQPSAGFPFSARSTGASARVPFSLGAGLSTTGNATGEGVAPMSLPLFISGDGLHPVVPITLSVPGGAGPTSTHLLFVDTGTPSVMVMGRTACAPYGHAADCFDYDAFTSPDSWGTTVDYDFSVNCSADLDHCSQQTLDIAFTAYLQGSGMPQPLRVAGAAAVLALELDLWGAEALPTPQNYNHTQGVLGIMQGTVFPQMLREAGLHASIGLELVPLAHSATANPAGYVDRGARMHLGGVAPAYAGQLHWAPMVALAQDNYESIDVRVSAVSVCGVDVLSPAADFILDSGAACLSLPPVAQQALARWLPVECTLSATFTNYYTCDFKQSPNSTAPAGAAPVMPTISLTLAAGGTVFLPLAELLLPPKTPGGPRMLCLMTHGPFSQRRGVLGAMALAALYTQIDYDNGRVGFATKTTTSTAAAVRNAQCAQPRRCRGHQRVRQDSNSCQDPDCSKFFLMGIDEASKECRLDVGFYVIASVLLAVAVAAEVALIVSEARMTARIRATAAFYMPVGQSPRDRLLHMFEGAARDA